jgi:hypothetical protein
MLLCGAKRVKTNFNDRHNEIRIVSQVYILLNSSRHDIIVFRMLFFFSGKRRKARSFSSFRVKKDGLRENSSAIWTPVQ